MPGKLSLPFILSSLLFCSCASGGSRRGDYSLAPGLLKEAGKLLEQSRSALNEEDLQEARHRSEKAISLLLSAPEENESKTNLLDALYRINLRIMHIESSAVSVQEPEPGSYAGVPLVWNVRVEKWIDYYTGSGRGYFSLWLERSGKYMKLVKTILREGDLPEDLACMVMVESGFNPFAYSPKKAAGLWQFIKETGKLHGLSVTAWFDERRDPIKATQAAVSALKYLYGKFGDWYLVFAAYNCGSRRVEQAIKDAGTNDFWQLSLPHETENFVPKIVASLFILKDPQVYGFDILPKDPALWEAVDLPGAVDFKTIARCAEMAVEELHELNPELNQMCTPPDCGIYSIRLPVGKKDAFTANFACLTEPEKYLAPEELKKRENPYRVYQVQAGDNLWKIAKKFRTTVPKLKKQNKLKSNVLFPGQKIRIYR